MVDYLGDEGHVRKANLLSFRWTYRAKKDDSFFQESGVYVIAPFSSCLRARVSSSSSDDVQLVDRSECQLTVCSMTNGTSVE